MAQVIARRIIFPLQIAFAAFSLVSSLAGAGEFRAVCYTELKEPCADMIKDVVTDEFTKKYPVSKFEIVILSNSYRYSDGASSGFAVAGVAPVNSGRVPTARFNSHFIGRNARGLPAIQADERDAIRSAVAELVAADFPQKKRNAESAQGPVLVMRPCRTVIEDELTTVFHQVCSYDSSGPTCHDEVSPETHPVSKQVCD